MPKGPAILKGEVEEEEPDESGAFDNLLVTCEGISAHLRTMVGPTNPDRWGHSAQPQLQMLARFIVGMLVQAHCYCSLLH